MKVTEHIAGAGRTLFSFEILPPKKGHSVTEIFETVEALLEFKPAFIDVTNHATQVVYKPMGDGLLKRVPVQKRPGTVSLCAAISYKYGVDTVPHLICSGFSRDETEDALIELQFLGLHNVMALRGDPVHGEKRFVPAPDGHSFGIDLVRQVADLNQGRYLHEETEGARTDFCIGVAGYPEKHMEAPSFNSDLKRLKEKVEAGAEFVVTQMFFENRRYFDFVARCREEGIGVPIIPGLKPITTRNQLSVLPQTFSIEMPDALVDSVERARTPEEVRLAGIDWCISQSRELIAGGAPVLHYYTMGRAETIRKIAQAVY
jgi:methylenetetrahydrofolate reductase (NADPH)